VSKTIYHSKVLGDETTEPIAGPLPEREAGVAKSIAELQALVEIGRNAEAGIAAFRKSCKHQYFTDEAGFPYDTRFCAVCGAYMGAV
jgi:hypothetical protein